jgi:sugar/nucleoside kinase (ribokinase family)
MLDECEHIHVTGSSLFSADIIETAKKAVALVKRNGGTFSFDPNIRKEMLQSPGMRATLEEMVRLCDVFLPSAAELAMLASGDEEVERVGEVFGLGVSRVVVKRGPDGASYHDPTGSLQAAGFLVEAVDPTGAGDCFDAAFTTCWLQRRSPEESVRYANAAGASAVRVRGPMEGTATFAQLDALIAAAGPAVATAE